MSIILNKKTLRKRKRRVFFQNVAVALNKFQLWRRTRKVKKYIRRQYIKTGKEVLKLLKHNYWFDLEPALKRLEELGQIEYQKDGVDFIVKILYQNDLSNVEWKSTSFNKVEEVEVPRTEPETKTIETNTTSAEEAEDDEVMNF